MPGCRCCFISFLCPVCHSFLQTLIMFTEVLLALVIGGLIYFLFQRNKNQVLTTEDGWWGSGAPRDAGEDDTICSFRVTTSDQELEVSFPLSWSHRIDGAFAAEKFHLAQIDLYIFSYFLSGPLQED